MTRFENEEWIVSPRSSLNVFETDFGRMAVAICYDVEFPEIARGRRATGRDLLVVPSCTDERQGFCGCATAPRRARSRTRCTSSSRATVGSLPMVPAVSLNYGQAGDPTRRAISSSRATASSPRAPSIPEMMIVGVLNLDELRDSRERGTVLPSARQSDDRRGARRPPRGQAVSPGPERVFHLRNPTPADFAAMIGSLRQGLSRKPSRGRRLSSRAISWSSPRGSSSSRRSTPGGSSAWRRRSSCAGTTTTSTPTGGSGPMAVSSPTTIPRRDGRSTARRSWPTRRCSGAVSASGSTRRGAPWCAGCGLLRIRAGARLRGYHRHAAQLSPKAYVEKVVAGELRDPTLSFQLREGFEVVAVVPSYLRNDSESLGHAVVIEWLNPDLADPADAARHAEHLLVRPPGRPNRDAG